MSIIDQLQQAQQKQFFCQMAPLHPVCLPQANNFGIAGVTVKSDGIYSIPGQTPGPIGGFGIGLSPIGSNTNQTQSTHCSDGLSWNGSNCVQNAATEVTLSCHVNQVASYNTDTKILNCSNPVSSTAAPPAQQKFTNVNGFKSRKSRNVESFSQNTNGKCKARY
jgi:hypothetical protein